MKLKIKFIALFLPVLCVLSGCSKTEIPIPTLSTSEVTIITEMTAVVGGHISSDNAGSIIAKGVCWSIHATPTVNDSIMEGIENGPGNFFCKLTGLIPMTIYYVRAFATNAGGTAYGEEKTFNTMAFELTTIPPYFITATSAISGATVSSDSDRPAATVRGVCWNKFPNPTTADNKTLDGDGKGSFSSVMSGLEPYTTYYVRAYITNSEGTRYGNEHNFTTQNGVISMVTDAVTSVSVTDAVFHATISGDGGTSVTDHGFCWSKFANPTITNDKVSEGNGTGSYSKMVTGLLSNTTYYVRAYATNAFGTIYGNEVSFTTLVGVPIACFDYSISKGFNASFTNCSNYPTTCEWDFGDGTTSTEKEPTHVYLSAGTYTVKLVVSNDGLTDSVTKVVVISDIVNIENTPSELYNGLSGRYIDVDVDGKKDFFVYGYSHTGPSQSTFETSIIPLSSYGIVIDSINVDAWDSSRNPANYTAKIYIPKRFSLGNTIYNSEHSTTSKIRFSYSYTSYYSRLSYDSWDQDEVRYLGYINKIGNNTKMGWIKFKLFHSVSPHSLKMPSVGSSLLIDN